MESQARRVYGYNSEYRSARPYYRRNVREKKEEKKDFREIILMQCIMSGVIMAAVLIICLINTPSVESLRRNIKTAVSENAKPEELTGYIGGLADYFGNAREYVVRILTGNDTPPKAETGVEAPLPTGLTDSAAPDNPAGDFRIDEEILQEINERNKLEEELQKKRSVPPTELMPTL